MDNGRNRRRVEVGKGLHVWSFRANFEEVEAEIGCSVVARQRGRNEAKAFNAVEELKVHHQLIHDFFWQRWTI